MKLFDLTGKKALVTGGGSGIGLAMAEGLLEYGATVVLHGSSEKAKVQAERLRAMGYDAHYILSDISKGEQAAVDLVSQTIEKLGGLDILVNAAGTQKFAPAEDFPTEYYNQVIDLNLNAVFFMCREAGKYMVEHGGGKIINIASMLSFFGGFDVPAYAASKGGVAQLTKAFGNAWGARGVNVNAVAPGFIETPLTAIRMLNNEPVYNKVKDRIPMHRWGVPEDFKGIAVFLASHASDYLNGCVIPVDGGYLVN